MEYRYRLPENLDDLLAAFDRLSQPDFDALGQPDVERLYRLAYAKGIFQAIRDWPQLRQRLAVIEVAKEECKRLLNEKMEVGTEVTNNLATFTMLFLQVYQGAYEGVIETAERSQSELLSQVRWLRHRTEADALEQLDKTCSEQLQHERQANTG